MADVTQRISEMGDMAAQLQAGAAGSVSPALDAGSLLGNMSMTVIFINIVAGLVGSGYFMYGKRTCNFKIMLCGVALCVVPYFISNSMLLIAACLAMAAAPFVI